jgi:hypothetical protein
MVLHEQMSMVKELLETLLEKILSPSSPLRSLAMRATSRQLGHTLAQTFSSLGQGFQDRLG